MPIEILRGLLTFPTPVYAWLKHLIHISVIMTITDTSFFLFES